MSRSRHGVFSGRRHRIPATVDGPVPAHVDVLELARAVLEDALRCLDLTAYAAGGSSNRVGRIAEEYTAARLWLEARSEEPFGFAWVCAILDADARRLADTLLRRYPPAPVRPASVAERAVHRGELAARIRAGLLEGRTLSAVAEELGVSVGRASVLSGSMRASLLAGRDGRLVADRDAGWTDRALAEKYRLSLSRVQRILRMQGAGRRRRAVDAAAADLRSNEGAGCSGAVVDAYERVRRTELAVGDRPRGKRRRAWLPALREVADLAPWLERDEPRTGAAALP